MNTFINADKRARAQAERARLRAAWPYEFADGARRGFSERSDLSEILHDLGPSKREAWFAGYNLGRCDRLRVLDREAA